MKIHVKHILVQHSYEAEDLLRKIQSGESFEKLAERFSNCPSAKQGGDLGPIDSRRLDSVFVEAAEALNVGETSQPVRTRFGYHLIQKIS